jgi:hypothetical protein
MSYVTYVFHLPSTVHNSAINSQTAQEGQAPPTKPQVAVGPFTVKPTRLG